MAKPCRLQQTGRFAGARIQALPPLSRNPELIGSPGERSPAEILLLLLLLLLFLGGGPGDEFDAALVSDKFFVVEVWGRLLHGRE